MAVQDCHIFTSHSVTNTCHVSTHRRRFSLAAPVDYFITKETLSEKGSDRSGCIVVCVASRFLGGNGGRRVCDWSAQVGPPNERLLLAAHEQAGAPGEVGR